MSKSMACPSGEAVKVVLIDTQYVKADPTSFKSVVQSLTGKDSCVTWVENSSFNGSKKNTSVSIHENKRELRPGISNSTISVNNNYVNINVNDGNASSFVWTRGMSFNDLDRMFPEVPPSEDLQYWFSDDL